MTRSEVGVCPRSIADNLRDGPVVVRGLLWIQRWGKRFRKAKEWPSSRSSQTVPSVLKARLQTPASGAFLDPTPWPQPRYRFSTKSSGQSNNNSDTCAEFRIKYVGAMDKQKLSEGKNLERPLDLINHLDVTRQDAKSPFAPPEEELVVGASKYGIRVSASEQQDVLLGHAHIQSSGWCVRVVTRRQGTPYWLWRARMQTTKAPQSLCACECNTSTGTCRALPSASDRASLESCDQVEVGLTWKFSCWLQLSLQCAMLNCYKNRKWALALDFLKKIQGVNWSFVFLLKCRIKTKRTKRPNNLRRWEEDKGELVFSTTSF